MQWTTYETKPQINQFKSSSIVELFPHAQAIFDRAPWSPFSKQWKQLSIGGIQITIGSAQYIYITVNLQQHVLGGENADLHKLKDAHSYQVNNIPTTMYEPYAK